MKTEGMNAHTRELIERELLAGERLLWVGKPGVWRLMSNPGQTRTPAAVSIMIGLAVAVFIGMGLLLGSGGGRVMLPGMVLALLVLIAFATLIGPLLAGVINSWRTVYAITDRRVLILSGSSARSYGEKDIQFIERRMQRGDRGDIVFRREHRSISTCHGPALYGNREIAVPVGFFGIDNVREVEALMLETFRPDEYFDKPKRDGQDEPEVAYLDAVEAHLPPRKRP